jgi:phytoene dehydrogenase-like protein
MSLFTRWVPAGWNIQPHVAELEAYANRMSELYDQVAPNFKASILYRDIVGPYQVERKYGLVGGNVFYGGLSLDAVRGDVDVLQVGSRDGALYQGMFSDR